MHGLEESEIKKEHQGIHEGYNDFKQPGYRGPAPPTSAPHRYEFKLYALDKKFEKLPHKVGLSQTSCFNLELVVSSQGCLKATGYTGDC